MSDWSGRRESRTLIARKAMIDYFKCSEEISNIELGRIAASAAGSPEPRSDAAAVSLVSMNYLNHVRGKGTHTAERPNQKQVKKKKRAKKKHNKAGNNTAREEMIRFFGCHKFTSTLILGYMVAEHLGLPAPATKVESICLVQSKYQDVIRARKRPTGYSSNGITRDDFYKSNEWRELRYIVLRNSNGACQCCGAKASDGVQIHVDHIKPRSKYPELSLDIDNIQLLCEDCNIGKSNYYNDDWRGLTKL